MPTKGCKNGLGLRPKNPVALLCWIRIRTARRWASKVSVTHFYRRCAGAQNGEPPPLSPPQRRGTRGRINKYFKVGGLRFLQALTPRERCSRFIVTNPSGPLSRHRERGWGERADTPVATLGAILCAVRIDFGLPSKINPYPAQPATGVLGQRPKRVLVPFTRVKGTPRRRAVLTKFSKRLVPPIGEMKFGIMGVAGVGARD